MGFFNLGNLSLTNLGFKPRKRSSTNPEGGSASASVLSLRLSQAQAQAAVNERPTTSSPAQLSYKELATALYTINSKYRISWECAELLIELGGGSTGGGNGGGSASAGLPSAPKHQRTSSRASTRSRAVTLAGDERAPTPVLGSAPGSRVGSFSAASGVPASLQLQAQTQPPSTPPPHGGSSSSNTPNPTASPPMASPDGWRGSTGRHDLSQRQLSLLKEMLDQDIPVGSARSRASLFVQPTYRVPIAEEPAFNRDWKWGRDPMGSTITLPDQDENESGAGTDGAGGGDNGKEEKPKKKKLTMTGFRDLLRALKKTAQAQGRAQVPPLPGQGQQALLARTKATAAASTTSLSAGSSYDGNSMHSPLSRANTQRRVIQKRRPKPVSEERQTNSPPPPSTPPSGFPMLPRPKSPKRPSLASIFRIGTSSSNKASKPPSIPNASTVSIGSQSGGHSSSCPEDDDEADIAYDGDDNVHGEDDWDQLDSASDLDFDRNPGSPNDPSATIRGASANKLRKKMATANGGVRRTPNALRDGKRSPYLQQDPYASRSSSGLGRRAVSGGNPSPNASSPCLSMIMTPPAGSSKVEEGRTHANGASSEPSNSANSPSIPNGTGSVRHQKLSDVQESDAEWPRRSSSLSKQSGATPAKRTASPHLVNSRSVSGRSLGSSHMTGSVRSMPPQPFSPSSISSATSSYLGSPSGSTGGPSSQYPDIKLIFTPENIRPLLENAREVQMRLNDCLEEMRGLLRSDEVVTPVPPLPNSSSSP